MRTTLLAFALSAISCVAQPFDLTDSAFSQNCSSLRPKLVAYWRLEETGGTARYDLSGLNNTLADNATVGQGTGVSVNTGNCATFVGASSQYLSIADNAALSVGAGVKLHLGAWCKFTSFPAPGGAQIVLGKWSDSSTEYRIDIQNPAGSTFFRLVVQNVANNTTTVWPASTFGALSTATWYRVDAWYDLTKLYICVNNGFVDSTAYTGDIRDGNATFCIGRSIGSSPGYITGSVDEVLIRKEAPTAAQLTGLYLAGLGTHFPFAHP